MTAADIWSAARPSRKSGPQLSGGRSAARIAPARYGGEEYLAFIPGSKEEGIEVAERIRVLVEAYPFPASTSDSGQTCT
jgi:PleD family two-component response regulator